MLLKISETILAFMIGLCLITGISILLSGCAGRPPIKKACTEIGQTASGEKLFEGCKDL